MSAAQSPVEGSGGQGALFAPVAGSGASEALSARAGRSGRVGRPRKAAATTAPEAPAAQRRLDNTTKNLSGLTPQRLTSPERRREKFDLRAVLWRESKDARLGSCGRRRIQRTAPVAVKIAGGVAHYANVQLCGSVHSCPVCAPKIRQERAGEIERGLEVLRTTPLLWGEKRPGADGLTCELSDRDRARIGGVEFLTLTLPHDLGDETDHLLKTVSKAFSSGVIGGRGYMEDKERFGVVAMIRSLDITYGRNGAHPHLHVLVITAAPLTDDDRRALLASFFARWAAAVANRGYRRPLPGLCTMEPIRSAKDVANYLSKVTGVADAVEKSSLALVQRDDDKLHRVGLEMTRHDLKKGRETDSRGRGIDAHRHPFQVLADFARTGDMDDLDIWHEWERAIKGHQAITWSRGLKAILGVAERTDEEIAEEEQGGEELALIGHDEWRAVTRTRGAAIRVLELAESAGAQAVYAYLSELLNKATPPPFPQRVQSGYEIQQEMQRRMARTAA